MNSIGALFVGEAPGENEDKTGTPFCGASGKMLDTWIDFLELSPEEYAVINCLKCRPPSNANPTKGQIEACKEWFDRQVEALNPQVIIALGKFAAKNVAGFDGKLLENAGKEIADGVYLMAHPSYYLRRGGSGWEVPLKHIKDALHIQTRQQTYVPLHVHTTYSITDSCVKLDELAQFAKSYGFPSMAITDHGTIGGWVEFQNECEKEGIKPLLGCEFYLCNDYAEKTNKRYHMVAIAKDRKGIESIFKMDDIAHRDGFYYKPRISVDDFMKYANNCVVMSACVLGIISQKILNDRLSEAETYAKMFKERWGDDFYLEIQPHNFTEQNKTNPVIVNLAKKLGIKLVVTTDSHFLEKAGKYPNDALKSIAFHKRMGEAGFTIDTNYVFSSVELLKQFGHVHMERKIIEKAMKNTVEIMNKCNARLERYTNALPQFEVKENEYHGV